MWFNPSFSQPPGRVKVVPGYTPDLWVQYFSRLWKMQIQFFYSAINRFKHISDALVKIVLSAGNLLLKQGFYFESLCIKIEDTIRSLFVQVQHWNVFFSPVLLLCIIS